MWTKRHQKYSVLVAAGLFLAVTAMYAWPLTTQYWKIVRGNTQFINDLGVASTGTVQFDGIIKVATATAATLTSPAVQFTALGVNEISLTADANLTGINVIGGVVGQIVTVRSGAGANTLQFDDATSMIAGANRVLTEGQNDYLDIECITAPDIWAVRNFQDN